MGADLISLSTLYVRQNVIRRSRLPPRVPVGRFASIHGVMVAHDVDPHEPQAGRLLAVTEGRRIGLS